MKGFPKTINNRNDLDNIVKMFPEDTKKFLDGILANRKIWCYVSELDSEEDGVVDSTHKVVVNEDTTNSITTFSQYELIDNLDLIKPFGLNSYEELVEYKGVING